MRKVIRRIKLVSLIFSLIQIVLIAAFAVFYFNDILSFKTLATPFIISVVAASLVFIDSLYIWIISLRISSLRQKSDLQAAEVIGSDVQEAYNFAMVALAVTNEKDVVIWTNDIFKKRHIDIIDLNIFEWKPELEALRNSTNSDNVLKIVIASRNYEVKYLIEAGLWIFKDTTLYEETYAFSRDNASVLGVLAIDNYDEVIRGEDDFNDSVTKVKNTIFNYAKEFGILLRRIKDDNYLMICTFKNYSKMKDDHFSIIDRVREVSTSINIPLTLSIGLARNFPDVNKLNELAFNALDIAMSRGGDQVVVSVYGSEMEFYGGKSEAQEKRNRVKIRVLADSLIGLLKNASNVLVMGHTNLDMDAFGACLSVKAICDRLEKPCKIVSEFKLIEGKTRSAIYASFSKDETERLFATTKEAKDLISAKTVVVVVDVHTPSRVIVRSVLEKCSKVIVIDHHRRAEEYIETPVFNHIDPAASSTCELMAEFIRFASINPRIEIPPLYATFMLSGIFLDSSYYKSKNTGIRTFEASTILKEYGADNSMADDFLKDNFEEFMEVNDIVKDLEHPVYGVVVSIANPEKIFDDSTISKAANECLSFKSVRASFVVGRTSTKEVKVSARSDGSVNVQLLAEKLGGGGHHSMAAVTFENRTCEEVKEAILNVLELHLEDAKNKAFKKDEGVD